MKSLFLVFLGPKYPNFKSPIPCRHRHRDPGGKKWREARVDSDRGASPPPPRIFLPSPSLRKFPCAHYSTRHMATSAEIATQGSGPALPEPVDPLDSPSRKRKPSDAVPYKNGTRQKITRACDSCKEKKTRCTGTLPCTRCTRLSLPCRYNAAYSRGLPPDPLPSGDVAGRVLKASRVSNGSRSRGSVAAVTSRDSVGSHTFSGRHSVSLRNSPEPGSTDFEGNYIGPASGVSFTNRVWSRLYQDETTHIPNEVQNESSANTAVFMFGDKPYSHPQEVDFTLPSFDTAMELVAIYFDFSMVTYRFLHRGSVEKWVKQVYESDISVSNLPFGNMVARVAIVLTIFAVSTIHNEIDPAGVANGDSER